MRRIDARTEERGAALFIMVVAVVVAAALAVAIAVVAFGRQKATETRFKMEQALAIAEAGLQRGMAEANITVNRQNPLWPLPGTRITNANNPRDNAYDAEFTGGTPAIRWNQTGEFVVLFTKGTLDNVDNDDDGLIDAADPVDEADYIFIDSTGFVGAASPNNMFRAHVQGQLRRSTNMFPATSAVFLQDPTPSVALGSGNSWLVSGKDHDMFAATPIAGATPLPAIATNGDFPAAEEAELIGESGTQLQGTTPPWQQNLPVKYDMDAILQFARDNVDPAHHVKGAGTDPGGPYGTPPSAGTPDWQLTFHDAGGPPNTVKFTGGAGNGAGIWVIDGDAEFGGNFNYTGVIIVTGRIYYRGGGDRNFMGTVIGGSSGTLDSFDANGNASVLFSSEAIRSASLALARYQLQSWMKVAN